MNPELRRQLERAAAEGEGPLVSAFQALGARVGAAPSRADVARCSRRPTRSRARRRASSTTTLSIGLPAETETTRSWPTLDLQNILQKQQQTMQMMSNISKMLYDTSHSVIRKMGG